MIEKFVSSFLLVLSLKRIIFYIKKIQKHKTKKIKEEKAMRRIQIFLAPTFE